MTGDPTDHAAAPALPSASGEAIPARPTSPDASDAGRPAARLFLSAEELTVSRRTRHTAVRVSTRTTERIQHVDEPLAHHRVDIEHVSVNRFVDAMPPTREVDGVTIVPVVEEVLVLERRLLLREEVHVRKVIVETRHVEDVLLRAEVVDVERTDLGMEPESG